LPAPATPAAIAIATPAGQLLVVVVHAHVDVAAEQALVLGGERHDAGSVRGRDRRVEPGRDRRDDRGGDGGRGVAAATPT
jgi:hypothetical protein